MKNEDKIAPMIEEIAKALEGKEVTKEEIENELHVYMDEYHVDPWVAKRSIVKKYGGDVNLLWGMDWTKIQAMIPSNSVNFLARVVSANPKEIEGNEGPKKIVYGIFGDETATVPFTLWEGEFPFEKGEVVRVKNAYVKEWQGQNQINMGARTVLEKAEDDTIPSVFNRAPIEAKIGDLKDGMRNVTAQFRIIEVGAREVTVGDAMKTVFSGIAGDDTGMVHFSAWYDFGLVEGGVYSVTGSYVRAWRGTPRLTFDEKGTCEKQADDALPPAEDIQDAKGMSIAQLIEHGGAVGIRIRGVLIDIKKGSGLVLRCPECNRVTQKGMCMVHGKVKGTNDLRIKGVLDDGTGAVTVILGRELTEKLSERKMDEFITEAQDAMTNEVVRDYLISKLLARPLEVRGNAAKDDFGVMVIAEDASPPMIDLVKGARDMLQSIEGGA
ncbi:MAG: hypothetical protein KAT70_06645 [Thermoplasmata archaeon]|nr:hypothetical protein [Thermoplasmata archaeon]